MHKYTDLKPRDQYKLMLTVLTPLLEACLSALPRLCILNKRKQV